MGALGDRSTRSTRLTINSYLHGSGEFAETPTRLHLPVDASSRVQREIDRPRHVHTFKRSERVPDHSACPFSSPVQACSSSSPVCALLNTSEAGEAKVR